MEKQTLIECAAQAAWLSAGREEKDAFNLCRIGQLLRETREKKGITTNEVSKALFIKTRTIEAIEAGGCGYSCPLLFTSKDTLGSMLPFSTYSTFKKELSSKEDETTLQGPEGVKKGILRGWKFRKKRAIGEKQVSDSSGEFRLPTAVSPFLSTCGNELVQSRGGERRS